MNNPLKDLYDAEDFFDFYNVPYNKKIVNVVRLHILKQFRTYLDEEELLDRNPNDYNVWVKQRLLLIRAYLDFLNRSSTSPDPFPRQTNNKKSISACSSCSNTGCKL